MTRETLNSFVLSYALMQSVMFSQPLIASLDFYCLIASQLQMAGCSTYVLTEKEFTANANQLISISNSIGDNWQLHHFKVWLNLYFSSIKCLLLL